MRAGLFVRVATGSRSAHPPSRATRRKGALAVLGVLASLSLSDCRGPDPMSRAPAARSLLALAGSVHERRDEDTQQAEAELAHIAALVREALGEARSRDASASPIAVLNGVVFGALGFVREVEDTSLDFVLLPSVLKGRRGNCVGLGTMYLAVGEMLDWQVEGVLRPGHFFVRIREGTMARNVELLRRGEEMPDSWYDERFPIPAGSGRAYGRGLSMAEVRGVVEYDVGNERRRQGRFAEARIAYERSTRDFPDLGEAYASLGAMQQLLGALDDAEASYGAARRSNPALPGLEQNVELLKRERAGGR